MENRSGIVRSCGSLGGIFHTVIKSEPCAVKYCIYC